MNVAAYLIAAFNLVYALEQVVLDFQTWKPVIFINLVLAAVALSVPFLHRFNERRGSVDPGRFREYRPVRAHLHPRETSPGCTYSISPPSPAILSSSALERFKLILALIVGGLVLHLVAWAGSRRSGRAARAALRAGRPLHHGRGHDLHRGRGRGLLRLPAGGAGPGGDRQAAAQHPADLDRRAAQGCARAAIIADELADASVLFADLKGFVPLAKRLGPARTVGLLNIVVSAFDDLADQWRVEKIKTIGDAYMAAAGVPEPAADHAERLAGMALAMQVTLARISREQKVALALRIGIATGPVLAGVIGARRLTYDVWGDTVNLASRLEGQSQPGRVLVSHGDQDHLEPRFALERCGPLELKGFGGGSVVRGRSPVSVFSLLAPPPRRPDTQPRTGSRPPSVACKVLFARGRKTRGLTVTVLEAASYLGAIVPAHAPRGAHPMPISAKPYAAKKFADIKGRRMAYIDEGAGAGDRVPARQPHVVLSVAQHHAPLRGPGPARRLRPDRHGRQRQARPLRPRPLQLRRAARLSVRAVGQARPRRQDRPRRARLGLGAGLRVGAPQPRARRRHRLHGGDRHARSHGPTGRRTRAAPSRASAPTAART